MGQRLVVVPSENVGLLRNTRHRWCTSGVCGVQSLYCTEGIRKEHGKYGNSTTQGAVERPLLDC